MIALDLQTLEQQIREFGVRVPLILRQNPLTATLGDVVENYMRHNDSPFTLAVVGAMKTGKSSLVNALVEDDLAKVGVTETTATVNWLLHGTSEQTRKFDVVWDETPPRVEEMDRSEIARWVGDSELARKTHCLKFYSTAEFLHRVQVVDTPGSDSLVADHTKKAVEFWLAEERNKRATEVYGGGADCVIYVVKPIARHEDEKALSKFGSVSRLPNSSPYNSVAVLHKWESLARSEPWIEAHKKAERMFEQLRPFVADVIPVSGPWAFLSQTAPEEFWDRLVHFASTTTPQAVEDLTVTQKDFASSLHAGLRIDALGKELLPWMSFAVLLRFASTSGLRTGPELRDAVKTASGIDRLREFLETRFFARSRVIRASTMLAKALGPTEEARHRLRGRLAECQASAAQAERVLAEIAPLGDRVRESRTLAQRVAAEARTESAATDAQLRELEDLRRAVRENAQHFHNDLAAIGLLEENPELFTEEEAGEIRIVLGLYGCEANCRIPGAGSNGHSLKDRARRDLSKWLAQCERSLGVRKRVLSQVINRLEEIAVILDSQS